MEGFVGWPEDVAAHYRASGLWEGLTIGEMFARTARRLPQKLALVQGEQRLSYAAWPPDRYWWPTANRSRVACPGTAGTPDTGCATCAGS